MIIDTQGYLRDVALFNDGPPEGYTRRTGKLFEIGDYPDKSFSLSAEEADNAIANYVPVAGDIEHLPTVLSGEVGILRDIWRQGNSIFGAADVPNWLHDRLDATKSTISCAWNRATKTLDGWGWVLDPRISGASLMSVHAQFKATQGQEALVNSQLPTRPVRTTTIRQLREKRAMPIFDKIVNGLDALFSAGSPSTSIPPTTAPAPVPAPQPTTPTVPAPEPMPAPQPTNPGPTAPAALPRAQFAAPGLPQEAPMDEAQATFRAEQIIQRAIEKADARIAEGRLYSSGRSAAIVAYAAAGYDNEAAGASLVTFKRADGTIVSDREALLTEVLNHVPKNGLFSNGLPVHVFDGGGHDKAEDDVAQGRAQADSFNRSMGIPVATEKAK